MSVREKIDIRTMTREQLEQYFREGGESAFRGRQVYQWLWEKSVQGFEDMSNLSLKIREQLDRDFEIRAITVDKEQFSTDKTIKSAFRLHDQHLIEGVLIPATHRMTACVSSQVGCSLSCKFCATGYMERQRNLDYPEIYDQVVHIRNQALQHYEKPLTNIVFMGMGEPLLNYQNVLQAINRITSPQGLGMAARRITVSTAGIAKMIHKLAQDEVRFNLALSLHAANDQKRSEIMPINDSNSLESLISALLEFYRVTGNHITLEYIVFNNFNDSLDDAAELLRFARQIPCKINLIEYNPINEARFTNAREDKIALFGDFLRSKGVNVNIRRSRGKDIDAACGQLANK
ncbi:MAG: 23S rRNA (adenine(2503)-C(2))-methyltransferase RlmN [Cyclobacteriaceae bacterium]|nr:23S rRNA (adenine(2503)-C(2))-methyltransferase RlmN [Cyclobacteriaceae bacterium]